MQSSPRVFGVKLLSPLHELGLSWAAKSTTGLLRKAVVL